MVQPLEKTIAALCSNPGIIKKIPYINVVDNEGKHVAMDNRRLYSFRMAFDDDYQVSRPLLPRLSFKVPVKKFASKDAYGEAEFRRKATSICGGHLVEMRTSNNTESLELPQLAGRLLQLRWCLGMRLKLYVFGNENAASTM